MREKYIAPNSQPGMDQERYSLAGHGQDAHFIRATGYTGQRTFGEYHELPRLDMPQANKYLTNVTKYRLGAGMGNVVSHRIHTSI